MQACKVFSFQNRVTRQKGGKHRMESNKLNLAVSNDEPLEIIELDDRLDLAADPLFELSDGCCNNDGCICPSNP